MRVAASVPAPFQTQLPSEIINRMKLLTVTQINSSVSHIFLFGDTFLKGTLM